MGPVTDSLSASGRDITLVAQKLRLQPASQSHREQLVTTAQQILLDTMKVRLMSELAEGSRQSTRPWEEWRGKVTPTWMLALERNLPRPLPQSQAQSSLLMWKLPEAVGQT